MIILNSSKELIRVESWADIEARPGFTQNLDPSCHELASIIGRYAFTDRIRCGLSNCHTPHIRGYIVCTKDGRETNIGKDCGKNYFGVDFELQTRQFDQDITDKENRERLWSCKFRLEELKLQTQTLRTQPNGADWVFHTSRHLVESGRMVPSAIVRKITNLVKTRQNVLVGEREATQAEVEQMEVARGRKLPRPQYVEVPIAELQGMDALSPENDLRQLLVLDIEQRLRDFESLEIDSMTSGALSHWNKWVTSIEPTLDRATAAVEAGRRLLRLENLQPLLSLLDERDQIDMMKKYLASLKA